MSIGRDGFKAWMKQGFPHIDPGTSVAGVYNLILEGHGWLQAFIPTKLEAHLIVEDELLKQVESGATPARLE